MADQDDIAVLEGQRPRRNAQPETGVRGQRDFSRIGVDERGRLRPPLGEGAEEVLVPEFERHGAALVHPVEGSPGAFGQRTDRGVLHIDGASRPGKLLPAQATDVVGHSSQSSPWGRTLLTT